MQMKLASDQKLRRPTSRPRSWTRIMPAVVDAVQPDQPVRAGEAKSYSAVRGRDGTPRKSRQGALKPILLFSNFWLDRLDRLDRHLKIGHFLRPPSQSVPGRVGRLDGFCEPQSLQGGTVSPRCRSAIFRAAATPWPLHAITRARINLLHL